MKRPSKTALLPNGFVDLGEAVDIAGRIEYPDEWTGEEIDAEWDWRYRHNLESCAQHLLEQRLAVLSELGDDLKDIDEDESLKKCKAELKEEDKKRNRPRQRREHVTVKLRQHLHGGLITAKVFLPSGKSDDIDEFIWAGDHATVILESGTVCVENGELRVPGSRGKQPETAYILLDQKEVEKVMNGDVSKGVEPSRNDIEVKCKRWLKRLIKGSPGKRVDNKDNLYALAHKEFAQLGHLSRSGFDRAWEQATTETGAKVWKAAGRPRGK